MIISHGRGAAAPEDEKVFLDGKTAYRETAEANR
jgi:hypothetical protein